MNKFSDKNAVVIMRVKYVIKIGRINETVT